MLLSQDALLLLNADSFAPLGFCHQQVYTVEEHGMDILMWSSSRNEENKWMYGSVVLSSNSPFRVAFEAEVGWSQPTEFALDDISFTPECIDGGMLFHKYISYMFSFQRARKIVAFHISMYIAVTKSEIFSFSQGLEKTVLCFS